MRCLKCWREIDGNVAIYTKSCQHVFCERCSGKAFKKELSCPLCDLVLAKDGVGEIVTKPDDAHLKKTGAKLFGLEPEKLCEVLQMGLEFWSRQKKNESIQHVQELQGVKARLQDAENQAHKLSKALEDEKLRKKSLQNEKEALQRHVAELETRYAEKARSMRKLSELYSELRQVHRRLESDLRGVRETPDYNADSFERAAIEARTRTKHAQEAEEAGDDGRGDGIKKTSVPEQSEQISFQGAKYREELGGVNSHSQAPRSPSASNSVPLETLFTLAPQHQTHPFALNRRHSKQTAKSRRRRQHSAAHSEVGADGDETVEKYAGKPRRGTRR